MESLMTEKRPPMFDANDISALDPKYFSIIYTDAFDVR